MGHLFERGFSVRKPAWHTLAEVLPDYPGRDEGMKLAGHDHEIVEVPIAAIESEGPFKLENFKALKRSDNNQYIGVVPSTYTVVQNKVPWELLDSLFQQGAKWETAGILSGQYDEKRRELKGQTYWCMCYLDEPIQVNGDDSQTFPFIAATWSHQLGLSVKFRATWVRMICANTVHHAMYGEGTGADVDMDVSIRHIGDVTTRIQKAKEAIQKCRSAKDHFQIVANELAAMRVSNDGIDTFIETVVPMPVAAEELVITDRVKRNIETARGQLRGLLNNGQTINERIRNTAYGLFESGIEFLDHIRPHRTPETYFQRNVMRIEKTKENLYKMVKEIAETYPLTV